MYGGITDTITEKEHHNVWVQGSPVVTLETRVLSEILDEANAPNFIDYFSLDTEGSEEVILRTFPFNKYTFGTITVEHNNEEPKRTNIRAILERNGYSLAKEVHFDDWYLNNIFVPMRGSNAAT